MKLRRLVRLVCTQMYTIEMNDVRYLKNANLPIKIDDNKKQIVVIFSLSIDSTETINNSKVCERRIKNIVDAKPVLEKYHNQGCIASPAIIEYQKCGLENFGVTFCLLKQRLKCSSLVSTTVENVGLGKLL